MKPTILLIVNLCLSLPFQAQVSKTVDMTEGHIKTSLTTDEIELNH